MLDRYEVKAKIRVENTDKIRTIVYIRTGRYYTVKVKTAKGYRLPYSKEYLIGLYLNGEYHLLTYPQNLVDYNKGLIEDIG